MGSNHFMVIIADDRHDTIKLPDRFTNRIGRFLRSPLRLRTRDYIEWPVNFDRVDGKILFTMGWREFADRYRIKNDYAVYFDYSGSSLFNVEIYHYSGIENPQPNFPLGRVPTKFFKFITTPETLRELKLPKSFTDYFHPRLENPLFIIPGDGTEWKVDWRIFEGQIQLYRGWRKYIPVAVVKTLFKNRPETWHFRLPSGAVEPWTFIWTDRPNEGYLRFGWYSFVENYPLVKNQKMRFFKEADDPIVHVEVI